MASGEHFPITPRRRLGALGVMLAGWMVFSAVAPAFSAEPLVLRSQSGQFVVRGLAPGVSSVNFAPTSGVARIRLAPAVLTVSCERIKQALLQELAAADQWRSPINVSLHPNRQEHEPIAVTSTRYADGWSYQVKLPERVETQRFLKTIVEVLLMEIANRSGGPLAAELPPWLADGLVAHLQTSELADLALESQTAASRDGRRADPLARAREVLRAHAPLTLNELNWPGEEHLAGTAAEVYRSCAHVFIHELFRLRNGRACLRQMLGILAEHLNWQTAFLRAFNPYFPQLLDADKWWTLAAMQVTARDPEAVSQHETSWRQLDETLATVVQVRLQPQELPMPTRVKLQSVISEWEFTRQTPMLVLKVFQLQALRLRLSPEAAGLLDEYRQTLESYLQKRNKARGASASKNQVVPNVRLAVNETVRRLDELDAQREILRRKLPATASVRP